MPNRVKVLTVSDADRVELARRVRAKGSAARDVERARIVLLAADGVPGKAIAARVGCAEPTVVMWRSRFAERGLAGLADAPRSGKPATIPQSVRDEILSITGDVPWGGVVLDLVRRGERDGEGHRAMVSETG